MKIKYYENDLPKNLNFGNIVAIDTETMGLNPKRDKLCLVQLSNGDNICHLVKIIDLRKKPKNLIKLLENNKIMKIFHYARFDVAVLKNSLKIKIENIYCTKIASKLVRTFTDKHCLKDLCKEFLDIEISKTQQTSDWGKNKLTKSQLQYAATDVLHLHKIKKILDEMLIRENRVNLAEACFKFINNRTKLDLLGWDQKDIFSH